MLFSKLFLKVEDEEIEPIADSIYNKQLHLPFRIKQTESFCVKFPISTWFMWRRIILYVNNVDLS